MEYKGGEGIRARRREKAPESTSLGALSCYDVGP